MPTPTISEASCAAASSRAASSVVADVSKRSGRMPSRQLSDAALVLIGGTLLLTPGFVTDIVGFFAFLGIATAWFGL